ncbi:hypothetical protein L917_19409 [Phytophthora nicotianae]|uniref:DUF6818 domain-containing protein n=1 Tax=Phytophthora nicotianae TaxID=4792 RepID=W2K4J9_PHYNI|nr:hypothetical protein L917_19409 [Phytophthora nicotianae]
MVKSSGSSNYKMTEIDRLLGLVEEFLPLGKDEWERLPAFFNVTKSRGWLDREYESLRRKFKVLYSTRKPTGVAEMPPHNKLAKELRDAIDEKANVVVMDDGADKDGDNFQPDFSFELEPDEEAFASGSTVEEETMSQHATGTEAIGGQVGQAALVGSVPPRTNEDHVARGGFQDMLASPLAGEELDPVAPETPRPATLLRTGPNTRAKARASATPPSSSKNPTSVRTCSSTDYQTTSNRLGGGDLNAVRDALISKRGIDSDSELLEASYAKSKRPRAVKATTALKSKLDAFETSTQATEGSMLETILLLREENERKSEIRRAEEDQRRRDDAEAREARRLSDKADAEERRRQDKLDMDERARRNKEESRSRTQEVILLIASLTKKA